MRELSLHLLDLLENACEAGATEIRVHLEENTGQDTLELVVVDNGPGLPQGANEQAFDPFFTSRRTRHVGLPLVKQLVEQVGGSISLESEPGRTEVRLRVPRSHWDLPPLGDIPASLLAVLLREGAPRLIYDHVVDGRRFHFDTADLGAQLAGLPPAHASAAVRLREYLRAGIASLYTSRSSTADESK
jgi:hypothetical protein